MGTGLFIHLMPVFGPVLSITLLGEEIARYHLLGAGLVFTGTAELHPAECGQASHEATWWINGSLDWIVTGLLLRSRAHSSI